MYREMRCQAADFDEGQGRRRARPARQRQRGVRHRRQLAAAGRRAFARRAAGGDRARRRRAPAPVHAVARGFGVRVRGARRPRSRAALPRIRRRRRAFRQGAGRPASRRRDGGRRRVDRRDAPGAGRLFPSGPPSDAAQVVGPAKLVKTPDQISCIRKACRITEEAMVDVQKSLAPGVRQVDLSAAFVRRAFELGRHREHARGHLAGDAHHENQGTWTTTGDLALPLLTTERELAAGDVLWTDVSITYNGYCSDFGRTWLVGDEPRRPAAGAVREVARDHRCRAGGDQSRRDLG